MAKTQQNQAEKVNVEALDIRALKEMNITQLTQIGKDLGVEGATGMRKQDLIFKILKAQTEKNGLMFGEGVLEFLPDGFGFLRAPDYNYLPCPDDIYVSPEPDPPLRPAHRRHRLRPDPAAQGERALLRPAQGRGDQLRGPGGRAQKIFFDDLTPLHPHGADQARGRRATCRRGSWTCSTPIGKGQRGLIVAPPRTGKTILLQKIANAIAKNHPEAMLIVLLIDERPEEVTDMQRSVAGRGRHLDLRRARHPPRPGGRDGDREGQAAGRAQEGRGHPARLDHPPGARLQHRPARPRARSSPAASTPTPCTSRSGSSARPATSRRAAR